MIHRLASVARQLLVSVDQFLQVLIVGFFYVVGAANVAPSADETISSYVGRGVIRGAPWAPPIAWVIDGIFMALGAGPDHCRRNVETAFTGDAPTP